MNKQQIADFCGRYFTATECQIIEKTPYHLKVKLSPEADRDLTGRPYYWNFVERTGAEPETMSFMFIFDPEAMEQERELQQKKIIHEDTKSVSSSSAGKDSILGRYFGMPQILPQPGRMLEETIVYGSRRLEQIFASSCGKGAYVQLFEDPPAASHGRASSIPYSTWLGINYKIEFICDMKKEEILSLGICMNTGEIAEQFHERLRRRKLTPRIPPHTSLREIISLTRAVESLEAAVHSRLKQHDYGWAQEAMDHMVEELERIDGYYGSMLDSSGIDLAQKDELEAQYARRRKEIEWQYRPRVEVCTINCGWFHLQSDTFHSV